MGPLIQERYLCFRIRILAENSNAKEDHIKEALKEILRKLPYPSKT